jgi:hypothetical protein
VVIGNQYFSFSPAPEKFDKKAFGYYSGWDMNIEQYELPTDPKELAGIEKAMADRKDGAQIYAVRLLYGTKILSSLDDAPTDFTGEILFSENFGSRPNPILKPRRAWLAYYRGKLIMSDFFRSNL